MFAGRNLLIATKHDKEKVIAPILEANLGVKCVVDSHFDTDVLGTFSGEVERKDDAITTVRNKCLMAMKAGNADLAIASEGSFGAHPSIYFVPADDEILMLIDKKNKLEIIARHLSTETNFNASAIADLKQLKEFAEAAKFPSHGLILKKAEHDFTGMVKGITDWETLNSTFNYFIETFESAYIETDMRAMYNPMRMETIKQATLNLVQKVKSTCPQCSTPGFDVVTVNKGLPCQLCSFPTRSTLSYTYTCAKCAYTKEEMYPNKKKYEDPMYCDSCNP
jgi:hypothetical protein